MSLPFNTTRVLNDGFVGLVDHMGDDSAIVQAARVSYGNDERKDVRESLFLEAFNRRRVFSSKDADNVTGNLEDPSAGVTVWKGREVLYKGPNLYFGEVNKKTYEQAEKDTNLIRYLMRHRHTTPFEMVEFKFIVRVPMDCWRQWIRHRTASVNEYSTRYTEAIDSQQTTPPDAWRLQATNNKQGSSGYLEEWPEGFALCDGLDEDPADFYAIDSSRTTTSDSIYYHNLGLKAKPGEVLSELEKEYHETAQTLYKQRLRLGVAKEQARKDLPLSTYTEAYWKIDLHNLFHFLSLRMDSHAQYEIRQYANAIFNLIKPVVPVACQAFEDYRLKACHFSKQEMSVLRANFGLDDKGIAKPYNMSDREWNEFKEKLK
jgi:thymidylate synthase (FAD)